MKILGIDEAGRGAVLGNLVIAGVSFKKTDINELINIGVKDSKKLTPKKREALFPEIMNLCKECKIIEVEPREIDDSVFDIKSNLNLLEIQKMGEIIDALKPSMVYIDAITSNPKKFTEMLKQHLVYKNTTIIAENKADELYPMVAAASIIAKVTRDRAIEALRKESKFQDIGSGYPSDPQTISSLKDWIKNRNIPFFVRKSWHTFVKMRDLQKNAKITQFFDVRGER
ncbi:ribonuclease HII [Candidatus Borrarchaeum sp.]|uniref:ribonuclease HII n=1 Tax=Candidatus Borrarchaeum sp. TaxID=2846742 RepID=UPI00257BE511|nr:ribonuclease HII [Candidatus Borrarchaeum sp.]